MNFQDIINFIQQIFTTTGSLSSNSSQKDTVVKSEPVEAPDAVNTTFDVGLSIPVRKSDALTGSQFAATIINLDLCQEREDKIYAQLADGNVPDFMRTPVEVVVSAGGNTIKYYVLPDVLCVGSNEDYLRVPLNPLTAQKVADLFNCTLPTKKMVQDIWAHSPVRLTPKNLPPTAAMTSTDYFVQHNKIIEEQLSKLDWELGQLVSSAKKDVVITNGLHKPNNRVAIYGWLNNGVPIQGLNCTSHSSFYQDYSHGIRLIDRNIVVDGQPMDLLDVMKDPALCGLVSDEGVVTFTRY